MTKRKVLYADSSFEDLKDFENAMSTVGAIVVRGRCKTTRDIIAAGSDAECIVTELIPLDETLLCCMDNVILTPHSAWLSEDALKQCKTDLINEIVRFFKNQPLKALLNPEVLDQPSS